MEPPNRRRVRRWRDREVHVYQARELRHLAPIQRPATRAASFQRALLPHSSLLHAERGACGPLLVVAPDPVGHCEWLAVLNYDHVPLQLQWPRGERREL